MQQSYRSPRQPVRTRSKPYTRRQPPPRSGSILATIRNIVTAPLSWFSTTDEFEDTPGKRRRVPVSQSNADASDEHRSIKRQKVAGQPPQSQGYLDPPLTMFQPRSVSEGASQDPTSTAFLSSMNANSLEARPERPGRPSLAANVRSRRDQSREVSMDDLPSRFIARDATMIPLPVSREASLCSLPLESSVGPVRASFRMRTTLSPIPVGSDYGPNPRRRERDPSEPPPLTALMSNPIFVKPPSNQPHRSQSAQPATTLGVLAQTSRAHNRVSPRQSSLHLGDPVSQDASPHPVNASEIALSELAIYRTPLLPTRLRGSVTVPQMFKPKKVHAVVPMKSGKSDLTRLGTGRKRGKKEEDTRKPYSAHGGVKKLLQRRKMEEEAEKEHADHIMNTSDLNAVDCALTTSTAVESIATSLPEPEISQHRVYARETSSLRVGRSRMNRPDRPTAIRPSRTKFSAAFEDDDPTDQKEQEVQRFEPKQMFEPPKDFTFARDKISAADFALPEPTKEPPIASLPFSLIPEPPKSFLATPALPTPRLAIPTISLSPPTPQKSESSSGIPNFFANSSLLTRTSLPPPLPLQSASLFGASPAKETPQPVLLVTSDQTPASTETKNFVTTSGPPETTQPIPTPPAPSAAAAPSISSPPICTTPPMKPEAPEPTPTRPGQDPLRASFPTPAPTPSTQPPLIPFGGLPSHNPAPESTNINPLPTTTTMEPNRATTSLEQKGPTSSVFSFSSSSGTPFAGFGVADLAQGPKPFTPEQSTPAQAPGEPAKPPTTVQRESPKETKPGFLSTFKFGASSTSPEKPTAPQFGEPAQGASNSGVFSFGSNSNTTDAQKQLFGGFPRPVTPPREEEEVRMEESPTRNVEVAAPRPNENPSFGGRVLNFGQNHGNTNSPFNFGGTASGDSNPFGSKLEKPKPSSGFTFGSPGSGFDQPSPAFTFGKADNTTQPATPSSPFTFGTSKLPDINIDTFGSSQATSPSFDFGQRSGSSPGSSGFAFSQQSPVNTSGPYNFGQGQTLAPPPFGQSQNGSVPNSPSTFNQPLPFGFGSATPTSTSNSFSFHHPSPITTTPSSAPGFSFGQQAQAQAQPSTPVSPFPAPGSPQPASSPLFNIGASPTVQSPGTRAIKKLPTRRGGARR